MASSTTIRRLLAGFLLIVFAMGITPKRTLHAIAANHKDGIAKTVSKIAGGEELGRSAYNCQVDNLVCESPFAGDAVTFVIAPVTLFPVYRTVLFSFQYSSARISFGLRGPPVA